MSPQSSEQYTCPSSRPERPDSRVIGIVGESSSQPLVLYLHSGIPVTPEIAALDSSGSPVHLTEFLRFASTCAASGCVHFKDRSCALAKQIVDHAPIVTGQPPLCSIRTSCRWRRQEGEA